jgi:signal transduction histidine kinase
MNDFIFDARNAVEPSELDSFDGDLHLETLLAEVFGNEFANQPLAEAFSKVERAKHEWESTVDALPELICVVDERGYLVRANRTVETWSLGLVQAVEGQELHRFLHRDCDQTCYLSTFLQFAREKALNGQAVEHEDYDSILRRHLHIRVWPVVGRKTYSQRHLAIIVHDITRRKEIEQAMRRNNERLKVLNAISSAILAARSEREIAQSVLKHLRPLVPFKQAYVLLLEPNGDSYCVLTRSGSEDVVNGQNSVLSPSMFGGSEKWGREELHMVGDLNQRKTRSQFEDSLLSLGAASYVSVPLTAENSHVGVFFVAMESLDSFEAAHIQTISEVAEMLTVAIRQSQLHRNLEETNSELQELLKIKHEAMQNVSHELRSPLALMRGFTDLLRDEMLGPLTPGQIRALDVLDSKGDQLFFLVQRLLTLHTIEEATLEKELVALDSLLGEEIRAWQVPAANNGVRLTLAIEQDLPALAIDPNRMRQVITNLLDNAMKYGGAGGVVRVRAWVNANSVAFSVTDQGMGIKPEKLDKIFDRFFQAHRKSRPADTGAGIGLALCKAIVVAHGGRIWAESTGEEKGSTFFVSLPLASDLDRSGSSV